MNDRLLLILDRLTACITNLMQENYALRKQLKEKDDTIAKMSLTGGMNNESQQ